MRLRLALAVVLACEIGCSSNDGGANGSSAPLASGSAKPVGTPDELLQERLRQAVRDLPATHVMRGPHGLTEPWTVPSPPPASTGSRLRMGELTVTGRLPPEVVKRIVRQMFGRFRRCYATVLEVRPDDGGKVTVTFTIARDGAVRDAQVITEFGGPSFARCVESAFKELSFPAPEGGVVKVVYPIVFTPPATPEPQPSASASAAAPASTASVEPPPRAVDATGPWPIVWVEGEVVKVDGAKVASASMITDVGRLLIIEELSDALKKRRLEWLASHFADPFPGVAGLRVAGSVPNIVAKSVFQTIVSAGYPSILVQSAEAPETIVEMAARLPPPGGLWGPPDNLPLTEVVDPVMLVDVSPAGGAGVWWRRGEASLFDVRIGADGDLTKTVCDAWAKHGAHRDPSDARRDRLVLLIPDAAPYGDALKAAAQVLACTRTFRREDGSQVEIPAHWIQLATL